MSFKIVRKDTHYHNLRVDSLNVNSVEIDTDLTVDGNVVIDNNLIIHGDLQVDGNVIGIVGETGPTGPTGPQGNTGPTGDAGFGKNWVQIGLDIDGIAVNDRSGFSVSLSADGSRVAIGTVGNNSNTGKTCIYQWNETSWNQLGVDIDGEAAGDFSGYSVSLSADGSRIAIGAPYNTSNAGQTRIYQWNETSWNQLGVDIDGVAAGELSGYSVSLSADGNTVAIGAIGNNSFTGKTRVYQLNGMTWTLVGADIDGEVVNDYSGHSVSLSTDGNTVAIGAPGNNSDAGKTRIFQWNGITWTLVGADIDGEVTNDLSGYSVSLSADGNTVAIGAIGNNSNTGKTRIFQYNGINWTPLGGDINGEAINDFSGYSVSLNADGNMVAIGAPGNSSNTGKTRIYQWNGVSWTQVGVDIIGEVISDESANSVSLSADGSRVAIGAPSNDKNGSSSTGHTRIYECSKQLDNFYINNLVLDTLRMNPVNINTNDTNIETDTGVLMNDKQLKVNINGSTYYIQLKKL